MKSISTPASLEKRIKRRVTGREQAFFAVTLPGLETLCRQELISLGIDEKRGKITKGGITFQGRVHEVYAANLHVRTASRILMRIDHFQATSFSQLEKQIKDFPWELYLHAGQAFDLKVTSTRSRLIHTDAIAARFQQGIETRFNDQVGLALQADTRPPTQRIFVRVLADRFTVSIDSSGAPLYKRGLKTTRGKAPLRETFAAAALKLTDFSPGHTLVDPMCGTGSFALEAAMLANRIPPGWFRDFAFTGWPCFQPGRWKHLRKTAAEKIQPLAQPLIYASDLDPDATGKLQQIVTKFDLNQTVQVSCRDFFELDPADIAAAPGTITLNPPYGIRLKSATPVGEFYARTGRQLAARYKGWNLVLILPGQKLLQHLPFKVDTLAFTHGGLNLVLATGKIR